ncbi:MAG: glycerate kinase [Candidatus Hydrogenedentes bacterium]|nr:glycerate kinase [Candidatus Hydrogenedentota bacterium]
MKIVVAPDSFKEALSAPAAAHAIAEGWRRVFPDAEIVLAPMADGGEGTMDALLAAAGGHSVSLAVTGPLGTPVEAEYALLADGRAAVIEMARASGLPLVPPALRDPRITTTRGTGELLAHALDHGVSRVLLGIGGSATNDGGAGFARALGYRLLDAKGCELPPGGAALLNLAHIDASERHPRLEEAEILVACDVDNPLCGPHGASHIFGPQKGATPAMVEELDAALHHFGEVLRADLGRDVSNVPGSGAAGGLGAAALAFTNARLESGVSLVAEVAGLREKLRRADLVLTGEGRLDGQTARGKTVLGVVRLASQAGLPVVALAGSLVSGHEVLYNEGLTAALCISPGPISLAEALPRTAERLTATTESVARIWAMGHLVPPCKSKV